MGLSPPKFIFILTNDYVKRFLIACSFEFIFYYLKASLPPNTVSNNRVVEEPEVIVQMVIFWLTLVTRQKTQRMDQLPLLTTTTPADTTKTSAMQGKRKFYKPPT